MKTSLLILLFAAAQALAQVPPPAANPNPAAGAAKAPGGSSGAFERRTRPFSTPSRPGSILAPSPGATPPTTTPTPGVGPASVAPVPGPGEKLIPPSTNAAAVEESIPAGMIDFRGANLDQVLALYADLLNKTILRAANLPDTKITLTTKTALTKTEARQALEATLGLNGIGIVQMTEKFAKASPLTGSGAMGAEFNRVDGTNLPAIGQFITHVIQLHYVKPSDLTQLLTPFSSGVPNAVFPIDASQIIVLRDLTENVKRMLELIKEIDIAVPSEFVNEVIPIKYAKAEEIASALNSLSSGGGGASIGGGGSTSSTSRRGTSAFGQQRMGSVGSQYGGSSYGGMGGYGGMGSYGGSYSPQAVGTPTTTSGTSGTGGTFADRLRTLMRGSGTGTGEITVLGQTKMIADTRSNSLLIYASKADMEIIKDIIKKLDIVLAQVLIEAVIIEVNLNDNHSLGVSYLQHPQTSGKFTGVGAINNNNFLSPGNFVLNGATNGAGGLPGGFSYLAQWNQDLDVAVTAAASDSRAKILQKPRIQTSHNEPATLFVGESRPYPTASYYGGGAYGGYSSIQQLEIGVTLEVTPLINPDGLVVMDIHQTIESANGSVNIVNVGDVPITSRKEAAAKVSVRDRDTIILGGLIETSKNKSSSGVPILKDIPLIGYAFRSSSASEIRNELIVLIRPTVLPTPEVAAATAISEKNAMPLVRQTEREVQREEAKRNRKADKWQDSD